MNRDNESNGYDHEVKPILETTNNISTYCKKCREIICNCPVETTNKSAEEFLSNQKHGFNSGQFESALKAMHEFSASENAKLMDENEVLKMLRDASEIVLNNRDREIKKLNDTLKVFCLDVSEKDAEIERFRSTLYLINRYCDATGEIKDIVIQDIKNTCNLALTPKK